MGCAMLVFSMLTNVRKKREDENYFKDGALRLTHFAVV